jgi:formylglycine-generating enzyme required for sulfatase activity
MSGNAWEWCSDTYCDYEETEMADPISVSGKDHVLRGGRWGGDIKETRVFSRDP